MADQVTETVFISSKRFFEVRSNTTSETNTVTNIRDKYKTSLHDRIPKGFSQYIITPGVHKYPKKILEFDSVKTLLDNKLISILDLNSGE